MRKIYPSLFNKFAVFILYGLLLVTVITLAQPPNNGNGGGGAGGGGTEGTGGVVPGVIPVTPPSTSKSPSSSNECPLTPISPSNQKIIGYTRINPNNPIADSRIRWDYYDHINVIAYPDSAQFGTQIDTNLLNATVQAINSSSTKIFLSIRNYDPSTWPNDEGEYTNLAIIMINITTTYNLSGIDIEYPGMRGLYCGSWNTSKDQSFVDFTNVLHNNIQQSENKPSLMLTVGSDRINGLDTSIIDFLNIEPYHNSFYINYKLNPPNTDTTGKLYKSNPNAPINAYETAYDNWAPGFDSNHIIMGVDLGNTFQVVDQYPNKFESTNTTINPIDGTEFAGLTQINFCPNDKLKLYSIPWNNLNTQNILTFNGGNCSNISINGGWSHNFDTASSTPWLAKNNSNPSNLKFYYISYEDFISLGYKLASRPSIGGISISDVSYDTYDNSSLVYYMQAIRSDKSSGPSPTGSAIPPGTSSGNASPSISVAPTNNNDPNKDKRGVIAGAVIGSVFGLIIISGIVFFGYRNRDKLSLVGQNQYSKNMYNPGTHMNQPGMIIPENSQRMILPDTAAIPVAPSYVTAMFDFTGKEENDLSFKKGDKIEVLERGDGPNDWWVGRVNGAVGEFPGNYVRE